MSMLYDLTWEPVLTAIEYQISEIDSTGTDVVLTTTTDTNCSLLINETLDHVFLIRAYDGTYYGTAVQVVYSHPRYLSDLRDRIRLEFKAATTKFPDAELEQYLREAIEDYAKYFPRNQEVTIPLAHDQMTYALPSDLKRIQRVKFVDANSNALWLKNSPWKGGDRQRSSSGNFWKLGIGFMPSSGNRQFAGHFDVRDGTIEIDFNPASPETLVIYYAGGYSAPVHAYTIIDVPEADHELLILYAMGKGTSRIEWQSANLDRWEEGAGSRMDNPLTAIKNKYFEAYDKKIRQLTNKGSFMRRVRI